MSRFLKGLGVFLTALGLIGAVRVVREIPFRNYRIAKQDLAASSLNADAAATLAAVYLAIGVAAGIGLGGAATGANLLGLGSVMDRLDLLTGQTSRRAGEPETPPVLTVTCPSCGERQNAPADRPHYDCAKCGEPVIRDWVQLGREA